MNRRLVVSVIILVFVVAGGAILFAAQIVNSKPLFTSASGETTASSVAIGAGISSELALQRNGGRLDSSAAAPAREISWERALDSARTAAYVGDKLIVVDIYTDWCGWCKKMDQTIYSSPDVAALSRDVVFLKLNAEDHGEGQRFARENGVTGYPTTFLLDSNGRPLKRQIGYISSTSQFIQMVQSVRSARS
jgi:thiol:disulfide interchange protein